MVTVVIAPDSFKGTADAAEVARAIAAGWASVRPGDLLRLLPMADGGEGTLEAFELAVPGARRMPVAVQGPDGRPVDAWWLLLPDGTGVVELANTSGLGLLDPLRPLDAHTLGFGQAIAAALDHGVERLLLAIGGSSSTDGGAGALAALGARFLDAEGRPVPPGNRGLGALATVDLGGLRALPAGGALVLSDVTNPLLGASGAAAVFGPQKGATDADVATLEANLARLARLVSGAGAGSGIGALSASGSVSGSVSGSGSVSVSAPGTVSAAGSVPGSGSVPVDPAAPGAGAAGGTGFGLLAWGATMAPGSAAVGDALGIPAALAGASVVITGEGRFDAQSAAGKVPSYLAALAADAGAQAMLVAGLIEADTAQFSAAVSLTDLAGGSAAAMADPLTWLRVAGARLAESAPGPRSPGA